MLRLETLMQQLVSDYVDFDEVVARFTMSLQQLRKHGYVALKSIVAYRSGLEIARWNKDQAVAAFQAAHIDLQHAGTRLTHKPLIDYLLHLAFLQAAEQHLPVQFHVGYGDRDVDLRQGNPLHLRDVIECREYDGMRIILLHECYPFTREGAYLATVYPHVFLDLSYAIPFLERQELVACTRQALSIAPANKLLYSSDGIHLPELHWVAAVRGRTIIGQVLDEMILHDEIDAEQGYYLAQQILYKTAYAVYGL
jgi:predicted TIM-barrel fold metal-dependent hydrolase